MGFIKKTFLVFSVGVINPVVLFQMSNFLQVLQKNLLKTGLRFWAVSFSRIGADFHPLWVSGAFHPTIETKSAMQE